MLWEIIRRLINPKAYPVESSDYQHEPEQDQNAVTYYQDELKSLFVFW
jgi:hypothetical protein